MGNQIIVQLTSRALKDLQKVRGFNDLLYGVFKSKEIINTIFETIEILENPDVDFTEIGVIDEDFVHLKYDYRKLITSHYKITYRKNKSKIYVVRIFDTRQNPNKNK
ncbi:type II toxin-antitoxin system RelE/ParE family toxin [Flavobacterium polysaccharolyticum]|uniref:Type II toxin-antitoxin system RelE/ParE family toxin n=1 Tax=Flavobacterium polysaccharolyticum TaxID=3133148 RepID=A0ABU9NQ74_9FLAO